jgi:hypothetical protein
VLRILGFARLGFAVVGLTAIVSLLIHNASATVDYNYLNFFSFFTVDANILAALVLLVAGAAALRGNQSRELSGLRGAVTTYMAITGIVYNLLLADLTENLQTNLQWANVIVHILMPIVLVVDFLIDRTVHRLGLRNALWWLVFPLVWTAYTLIRGAIVDWFPYPFLDHRLHSIGFVALYVVGIAVAFFVVSTALAYSTRVLNRSEPKPVAPQRATAV